MTPRPRKLRRESVGGYGYTVNIFERRGTPFIQMSWYGTDGKVPKSLAPLRVDNESDWEKARQKAKNVSASLLSHTRAKAEGSVTVEMVIAHYETTRMMSRKRQNDEKRRCRMWLRALGPKRDAYTITPAVIEKIGDERTAAAPKKRVAPGLCACRCGQPAPIAVRTSKQQGVRKGEPLRFIRGHRRVTTSKGTFGADIRWLKTVYNVAVADGVVKYSPLHALDRAFMRKYRNVNVRRPLATQDHFEAVRDAMAKYPDKINPRFPFWLRLLNELGWRETATCEIRASDIDRRWKKKVRTENGDIIQLEGRILKREESDKMGVERWVPMSAEVRETIDELLRAFPVVGDVPLFPAARNPKRAWRRFYASKQLARAERLARIGVHYPPHAYRRKWATERKHLPRADVAYAGAWLSPRTLDIYDLPDDATVYAVVNEPRRLREAK